MENEYVKMGNMIIEAHFNEMDDLFKHLWEEMPEVIELKGAEIDYENDFGKVTHRWIEGKLVIK